MEQDKPYQLWLRNAAGAGGRTKRKLLQEFGSAEAVYKASEKELDQHLKPEQITGIMESKEKWEIFPEYEKLVQRKIKFTCYSDEDYPERLKSIPDPPFMLYYQGRLPSDKFPAIAIIGARECSEYGSFVAQEFGSKLAAAGIQIISGLAIGIDGLSQEAALSAGGASFGVLGCGVDVCYPKRNRFLYERLKKNGGILSEYIPGTPPKANLFPPRNRIISGLSDAVLVVEAKEKSGTLITVDMALEQGRDVFAVPGRVTDALSEGCHKLLRQGAGIAACPDDILETLYGVGSVKGNPRAASISKASIDKVSISEAPISEASINKVSINKVSISKAPINKAPIYIEETHTLSPEEKQILGHLDILSKSPEEILQETGKTMTIQEIMWILVELCMKGLAEQGQEGRYRKKNH